MEQESAWASPKDFTGGFCPRKAPAVTVRNTAQWEEPILTRKVMDGASIKPQLSKLPNRSLGSHLYTQQHAASPSSHETPPGVPHEWTWPTVTGLDLQLSVQSFSMELAPFIIFSSSYFLIFENVLLKKTECGKKPLYYYRRKGDIVWPTSGIAVLFKRESLYDYTNGIIN